MPQDGVRVPRQTETTSNDVRFCPYCFLQQFDLSGREGATVYCEMCGVDIEVKNLEKL